MTNFITVPIDEDRYQLINLCKVIRVTEAYENSRDQIRVYFDNMENVVVDMSISDFIKTHLGDNVCMDQISKYYYEKYHTDAMEGNPSR